MLLRVRVNRNPHTLLLVKTYNGVAALDNNLTVPQKVELKSSHKTRNSTPRYIL